MAAEEAAALRQWALELKYGKPQGTAEEVREKVERCVELLERGDVQFKRNVVHVLGDIADSRHAGVGAAYATVAPRVLEGLMACLGDRDAGVRRNAARALGDIAGSPHAGIGAA